MPICSSSASSLEHWNKVPQRPTEAPTAQATALDQALRATRMVVSTSSNPNVVRASKGTVFSVPVASASTAEVFASQGIMGRFADRTDIQALFGPGSLSLNGKQAWFVIAPLAGIETLSTASAMALVGELAGPIHATLVTHANDVWAFRWNPPPGVDTITVPGNSSPLPAWAAAGVAGRAVMIGPTIGWHVTSTGASGYITDGLA